MSSDMSIRFRHIENIHMRDIEINEKGVFYELRLNR